MNQRFILIHHAPDGREFPGDTSYDAPTARRLTEEANRAEQRGKGSGWRWTYEPAPPPRVIVAWKMIVNGYPRAQRIIAELEALGIGATIVDGGLRVAAAHEAAFRAIATRENLPLEPQFND